MLLTHARRALLALFAVGAYESKKALGLSDAEDYAVGGLHKGVLKARARKRGKPMMSIEVVPQPLQVSLNFDNLHAHLHGLLDRRGGILDHSNVGAQLALDLVGISAPLFLGATAHLAKFAAQRSGIALLQNKGCVDLPLGGLNLRWRRQACVSRTDGPRLRADLTGPAELAVHDRKVVPVPNALVIGGGGHRKVVAGPILAPPSTPQTCRRCPQLPPQCRSRGARSDPARVPRQHQTPTIHRGAREHCGHERAPGPSLPGQHLSVACARRR